MADNDLTSLGLTAPQPSTVVPSVDQLQFQRAEALADGPTVQRCLACKQPIIDTYFHAAGHVVCPRCAERIQQKQQAPPAASLARAALYGLGAALAGCAIYATVWMVTGFQVGLVAILVGIVIGKVIRHACGGLGGRPQQILAVLFTYFAITISILPVAIYHFATKTPTVAHATTTPAQPSGSTQPGSGSAPAPKSSVRPSAGALGIGAVYLLTLAAVAPFRAVAHGSGLISLLIIFFGLLQAWRLTGRTEILIIGPYQVGQR